LIESEATHPHVEVPWRFRPYSDVVIRICHPASGSARRTGSSAASARFFTRRHAFGAARATAKRLLQNDKPGGAARVKTPMLIPPGRVNSRQQGRKVRLRGLGGDAGALRRPSRRAERPHAACFSRLTPSQRRDSFRRAFRRQSGRFQPAGGRWRDRVGDAARDGAGDAGRDDQRVAMTGGSRRPDSLTNRIGNRSTAWPAAPAR
jgi:hypothetical protein